MCLGVPGRIVRVDDNALGVPTGRVDFGGVSRDVCLAYVPDAVVGEYVIVHVGFAISRVDEAEARRTYEILREMNKLDELDAMRAAADQAVVPAGANDLAPPPERGRPASAATTNLGSAR